MDKNKILVVDDDQSLLFLLEKRLTKEGYSVATAENGYDAIALAKSQCPDLIILDLVMPGMEGSEVSTRLKEDPKTANIPIIFLTALISKEQEERKKHIIANNIFVAKPFDAEDLLGQVRNLLQLSSSPKPTAGQ